MGWKRVKAFVTQLCPTLCNPVDCRLRLCPWDFPGKNTGVCCYALLQETFLTQDGTHISFVSCFGRQGFFTTTAAWEALTRLCPLSKCKQEWFCSLLDFQCLKVLGMESVLISIHWIYEWMREGEREGLREELQTLWNFELSYEQKAGISAMDRVWVNPEQTKSMADNREQWWGKARVTADSLAWLAGQGMLGTDRRWQAVRELVQKWHPRLRIDLHSLP